MLALTGIKHSFPESEWELDIPLFELKPGEILGIIGPNGSGKSTLLRIAAGILPPVQGTVHLKGRSMREQKRPDIARILGYLPQELSSEYDLTVAELVRMGRYPHTRGIGILHQADIGIVRQNLERTGLSLLSTRRLSQLSGGEKKRAFLASVLTQAPEFLLLDEPTAALDLHRQVDFFHLLKNLAAAGIGIAVVTHDINLAALFCDGLTFLNNGSCLAQGPPNKVLVKNIIHEVFGPEILMGIHPESDRPIVLPRLGGKEKT